MFRGPVSTMHHYQTPFESDRREEPEGFEEDSESTSESGLKKSPVILRRNLDSLRSLSIGSGQDRSRFSSSSEKSAVVSECSQTYPPYSRSSSTHRRPAFADGCSYNTGKTKVSPSANSKLRRCLTVPPASVPSSRLSTTPESDSNLPIPSVPEPGTNHLQTETNHLQTELTLQDLQSNIQAYNGSPIYIVPEKYYDLVAQSFTAGMYGLDTESDYYNSELRIIQVYTGSKVYIFPVNVLDRQVDNFFIKFLKSKDRIKVGVDIDGDAYRIKKYVQTRRHSSQEEQSAKYKFTINGTIDLQSIAHSFHERGLSLEKLAFKYVEDFQGNPSDFGSYLNPSPGQYIYAANDAVLSLLIYYPLIERNPCSRWRQLQVVSEAYGDLEDPPGKEIVPFQSFPAPDGAKISEDETKTETDDAEEPDVCPLADYETFRAFVFPLVVAKTPRKLSSLFDRLIKDVQRWPDVASDELAIREAASLYLETMLRVRFLDIYDPATDKIWIGTPDTLQVESELPEADFFPNPINTATASVESPLPKPILTPKRKKNRKAKRVGTEKNTTGEATDIFRTSKPKPTPTSKEDVIKSATIDSYLDNEEKRARLRERIKEARWKRNAVIDAPIKVVPVSTLYQPAVPLPTTRPIVGFREHVKRFQADFESYDSEDKKMILQVLTGSSGFLGEAVLEELTRHLQIVAALITDDDYYSILLNLSMLFSNGEYSLHGGDKNRLRFMNLVLAVTEKIEYMTVRFPLYHIRLLIASAFVSLAHQHHHINVAPR